MEERELFDPASKYRYPFTLATPNGDQQIIICIDDEVQKGSRATVEVGCKYLGMDFYGQGSDFLWIDSFVDLQRKLPEEVFLKCCLTCRHGNQCPVGSAPNELFCTKDIVINQKSDLYFYTEDDNERTARAKQYCNLCESYEPQSYNYYTYNDYWYFLHSK